MFRRILDIVGLPVYAAQILTGRKSFDGNPLLGSVRLNRKGLHVWRTVTAAKVAAARRHKLEHLVPETDRADFARDGFVAKPGLLPDETFRRLVQEIRNLRAPAREMVEGRAVTRRIAVTPDMLARLPALKALLDTPEWKGLIRYVGGFDVEPAVAIQTIFGTPSETGPDVDPQTRLHMDTFHPTVKAWFFLEDVDPEEGPFTYVPGSHVPTRRRLAWQKRLSIRAAETGKGGSFRVADEDLKSLRLPPRRRFAVPGNTLVVGDTYGFHARGRSLRPSTRVEIYASQRPNPFNPFVKLDTALIPGVSGRKMPIGWWFEDLFVRLGLTKRIWNDVGPVNPWEPPKALGPEKPRRLSPRTAAVNG
jgi:hypothetical protein